MNTGPDDTGSGAAVLRTLGWIRGQGFRPVPLRHREKAAAIKGYTDVGYQPEPDAFWLKGRYGVGVLTGPERDGPIDADLDCHESVFFAEKFFPPTPAIFGRDGKPRSHRLYRVDVERFAKVDFKDPQSGQMILELRGDGGNQTVFPGSLHEGTGELVRWETGDDPEVAAATSEELVRAGRLTAMATLISRYMWNAGARNDPNMAIAGTLLKLGWSSDDITLLITAVMEHEGDRDRSRIATINKAVVRFDSGQTVMGIGHLRKMLGSELAPVVDQLIVWAGGDEATAFPDLNKNDSPRATVPNTVVALRLLGIDVRYDLFKLRENISGHVLSEFAGDVQDPVLHRLRELIHQRFFFYPGREMMLDAVHTLGNHGRYHPVLDYLDGLEWDGQPRIDNWLTTYGGAEDTPFVQAAGAIFLTAAVRRVRDPGCKFDEILVLESEQGRNKSQALEMLAVNQDWFTDQSPLGRSDKEVIELLSGRWIVEVAELKGMKNSEVENVKAFTSRRVDSARMAYAITSTDAPRQCVFFATTNDPRYLRDKTGNRRFWPVRIERFDLERLAADRDQLWAEAAHREASGASIRLPEELWDAAAEQQFERMVENTFLPELEQLLSTAHKATSNGTYEPVGPLEGKVATADLWAALELPVGRRGQHHLEQLAEAMKELGWRKPDNRSGKLRMGDSPQHVWVKGEGPEFRRICLKMPTQDRELGFRYPAFAYYPDEPPPDMKY